MSPIGPSPSCKGGCTRMCRNMGNRKARVLPEPVLATAMRSRPHMMAGMAMESKGERRRKESFGEGGLECTCGDC